MDVLKLYPPYGHDYDDYGPIINAIGTVQLQEKDGDYEGDTYVLYHDPAKPDWYGFLVVGWGSCPGCDALLGCSSWEDVQELADQLERETFWSNALDMVAHLTERDEANTYYWHREGWLKFWGEALTYIATASAKGE